MKGDRRVYRLLESLLDQTAPTGSYDIVVVENGSAVLGDVGALGHGTVRCLHTPQANMAAARNIGLDAAKGRYVLLIDADCVASRDWIEQLTNRLASGSFGAVRGAIRKYQPKSLTQRYGITVVDGQRRQIVQPALTLPYVAGANAGFVTAALREVGGFDEAFKSGNEVDICYRLGLRCYTIGLAPQAVVLHEDRASVRAHFRRFKDYAVYQVLLYAKYKRVSGRRFIVNPYPFARVGEALAATPRALAYLFRGDTGPYAGRAGRARFFGPGRFRGYLRDPRTKDGLRARLLALSALAICLEWLSCAVVPALLALALWRADNLVRALAAGFIALYGLQLLATEAFAGSTVRRRDRVGRVLAYPSACTLFGVGGIIGAAQLLSGGAGAGKTERASA